MNFGNTIVMKNENIVTQSQRLCAAEMMVNFVTCSSCEA